MNVLDDEQALKKSNAASDKDSLSGDTNANADENKEVSESYLYAHPKPLRKMKARAYNQNFKEYKSTYFCQYDIFLRMNSRRPKQLQSISVSTVLK